MFAHFLLKLKVFQRNRGSITVKSKPHINGLCHYLRTGFSKAGETAIQNIDSSQLGENNMESIELFLCLAFATDSTVHYILKTKWDFSQTDMIQAFCKVR